MKLVTYLVDGRARLGAVVDGREIIALDGVAVDMQGLIGARSGGAGGGGRYCRRARRRHFPGGRAAAGAAAPSHPQYHLPGQELRRPRRRVESRVGR